jgi:phage terminase small subunit
MGKLIVLPAANELGPAMACCTEKQQRFVLALAQVGGNAKKACLLAGYSPGDDANHNHLGVEGWRNMHNKKVLAAIREVADQRIHGGGILAASVLVEIAMDPMHKDRLKAAVELANRGGLEHVQKHEVLHKDERLDPEVVANIIRLAREQGVNPQKYLGYDPDKEAAIEGEFEDVTGMEGLEDLLE